VRRQGRQGRQLISQDGGLLIPVGQAKTMSGVAGVFHFETSFLEPAGEPPVDIIIIVDQHHA
jgi:hypothetical protein